MVTRTIVSGRALALAAGLIGAASISGCGITEQGAPNLLVAPGGYEFYSCPQLVNAAQSLRNRQKELENLMAKAESDASGKMMSALSYRPDYLSVRGQLREVERTARQKQCDLTPPVPRPVPPAPGKKKPRTR